MDEQMLPEQQYFETFTLFQLIGSMKKMMDAIDEKNQIHCTNTIKNKIKA
jgi:hypothetical protein